MNRLNHNFLLTDHKIALFLNKKQIPSVKDTSFSLEISQSNTKIVLKNNNTVLGYFIENDKEFTEILNSQEELVVFLISSDPNKIEDFKEAGLIKKIS